MLGTRYEPTAKSTRLMALNSELQSGAKAIADWLTEFKGTTIPYNVKNVECC